MKNVFKEAEKRLKSSLKHNGKINFSKTLVLSFLLTGGLSVANTDESVNLLKESENLNNKIKDARRENKKKLRYSKLELNRLELEGDQVVKSPWESHIFSTSFSYKDTKKKDKEWKFGSRTKTTQDAMRDNINSQLGISTANNGTTGWITETQTNKQSTGWSSVAGTGNAWDDNTATYDNTHLFSIMATVTPKEQPHIPTPNINPPTLGGINAPAYNRVSISVNEPALIGSINISPVTIGFIGVTPPLLGAIANVNSPDSITVSGVDPNININVVAPGEVRMDVVIPPRIDVTPPTISVTPQTPPRIEPPVIEIPSPKTVAAPNFANYVAPGGNWINAHGSTGLKGINRFDPNVLAAYTTAVPGNGTTANLASGIVRRLSDPAFPMFSEMNIQGAGGGRGRVYAIRDTSGGRTGYANVSSDESAAAWQPIYWPAFPGNGALIAGSAARAGYTAGVVLNGEINQKNRWIMTIHKRAADAPTYVTNIDFDLGGPDGVPGTPSPVGTAAKTPESGVLLMRNDGDAVFTNSTITLRGRTTINQNQVHWGNHYPTSLQLNNVTINIVGDSNTLFTNVPHSDQGYWSTAEENSKQPSWGLPQLDNGAGAKGIIGKTDLDIDTKVNTIFFIQANTSYRWNGYNAVTNPEGLLVFTPLMGRILYYNRDGGGAKGSFNFNGSGNVGTWVNKYTPDMTAYGYTGITTNPNPMLDYTPRIDVGTVNMRGDSNVGLYFTQHNSRPDYNGIYQGILPMDFRIGEALNKVAGGQSAVGNVDGDATTSSGNVALYVTSGQRKELTVGNGYFPATTNLIAHSASTNTQGTGLVGNPQIAYPSLNTGAHAIKDLTITDYSVIFGKYSKDNIAVVSRNGSVVKINPSGNITDGAVVGAGATGSIIAYAEGIWYNPRPAVKYNNNGTVNQGGAVTDGTPGQKYVANFGSEVHLEKNVTMGSKGAIPAYAKDGAKIFTKNITLNGVESIGVYADGRKEWDNAVLQTIGAGTGGKPQTNITVTGDIVAKNGNNNKGAISLTANKVGATEVVNGTGDGSKVTVSGKLDISGLGAYADGAKSIIEINGAGSIITSSVDGALVAKNGGKIKFAGGTIYHNHANSLAFFAGEAVTGNAHSPLSNINFTGTTTVEYKNGIVFYGKPTDYSNTVSTTARYGGMGNLTVLIKDHGVNLGVFEYTPAELITTWTGNNASLIAGLKNRVGNPNINTGSYWIKSALDGGKFIIDSNINRDSISAGSTTGDQFNDITMERVAITLNAGKTISSNTGKGMLITSNSKSTNNNDTGYTINGKIDVKGTDGIGTFTNFGHTVVNNGGEIATQTGVGVYGVNGSRVENKTGGKITVGTTTSIENIGIVGMSEKSGTPVDNFGFKTTLTLTAVTIVNNGDVIVKGNKSMGIYADNNVTSPVRVKVQVTNEGKIEVIGDEATGIYANAGTITLKNNNNIIVGKDGKGVYGKDSDLNIGNTSITVGDNGVGLFFDGTTNVTPIAAGNTLDIKLDNPTSQKGTAIYFTGLNGEILTNNLNIRVGADTLGVDDGSGVTGIYGVGKKVGAVQHMPSIINTAKIIVGESDKGIYGEYINVTNTGEIELKEKTVGIYAKNSNVITDSSKIKVNGDETVGVYARWGGTTTMGTASTQVLAVNGKKSIGIYIEGYTLNTGETAVVATGARGINAGTITLANTVKTASSNPYENLKVGMYLTGGELINSTQDNQNAVGATINVGANNIGVYGTRSEFSNLGTINNRDTGTGNQNIGIYFTDAASTVPVIAGGDKFRITNTGTINVEGENNLGIFANINDASGKTNSSGVINLNTGGVINVKPVVKGATPVQTPIGLYLKGSNITVTTTIGTGNIFNVDEDGIGIYSEGANKLSTYKGEYNLKSSLAGTIAVKSIGIYLKDGSVAQSGDIKLSSTTGNDSSGDAIRPIGVYYSKPTVAGSLGTLAHGLNIADIGTGNGKSVIGLFITGINNADSIANSGNITLGSNESLGAYVIDSVLSNTGIITANGNNSYGVYLTNSLAFASQDSIFTNENTPATGRVYANANKSIGILIKGDTAVTRQPIGINKGIIESGTTTSGIEAVGVHVENGKFTNDKTGTYTGLVKSNLAAVGATAGSIGISSKNGEVLNKGNIISEYVGIYSEDSKITHQGDVSILSGTGIIGKRTITPGATSTITLDKDTVTNNASIISGTANGTTGVLGLDGTAVTLKESDISLTGNNTFGILLTSGVPSATNKSSLEMLKGNIIVGNDGIAVYSSNGNIDIKNYDANSKFTLGERGIGVYANTSTNIDTGVGVKVLNVDYTSATNKGVGVYYEESTGLGNRTNTITVENVNAGAKENFVNILSNNTNLTNNADQVVGKSGIGIYGTGKGSIVNNNTIFLNGETAVGLYAKGTSATDIVTITKLGTIKEVASNPSDYKERIGAYIDTNANITGTDTYTFDVDGGIGMYLKSYVDYAGTMTVGGTIYNDGSDHRAIGIYVDSTLTSLAKDLNANIQVTGEEAVGMYLSKNLGAGAAIKYNGTMDLLAVNPLGKYGIGIYLSQHSNLDFAGTINIGGATGVNNIGFYIENNATSSLNAGTINTNNSGILAYIKDGTFSTSGSLTINGLTNIIVEGTLGSVTNGVTVEVGTTGLQGISGATVINQPTGTLWSTVNQALGLSGSNDVKITNEGTIQLLGDNSVGIFTKDSIATLKNGSSIEVGKKGVGVYALLDNNTPDTEVKIDTGSSLIKIGEDGTGIAFENKIGSTGSLKLDFTGGIDIQGTNGGNKGIYLKDTLVSGVVNGTINLSDNSTGIFSDASNFATSANITVGDSMGIGTSVGIYAENGAIITNTGTVQVGEKGIAYFSGNGATINTTGTNIMANKSTIAMTNTGGIVNYNNAGDVFIGDNEKKGFVADGGTINLTGGKVVNVGDNNSVGVIIGLSGIVNNINSINVGNSSTGVYIKDSSTNYTIDYNVSLNNQGATGLSAEGGVIVLDTSSTIASAAGVNEVIGIINRNATGIIDNQGTVNLSAGTGNIGIYGNNVNIIRNGNLIVMGDSTSTKTAVAIYADVAQSVLNNTNINVGSSAIGIYGKNITNGTTGINNTGSIASASSNAIGIYGESSIIENTGNITTALAGVGIYGRDSKIENTGTIITGDTILGLTDETAVGIYTTGNSDVRNANNINVGLSAVGIFGENGTIINDSNITAGESSIYIFSNGANGNIINNSTLNLTDKSVGIYATSGTATNSSTGIINVGKSDVMSNPREFGVGMATETGTVINEGIINVDKESGVGMYAGKKNFTTGMAINKNIINVTADKAYGMQVNEGATALNEGTINVSGNKAFGIAASKQAKVYNGQTIVFGDPVRLATINVTGTAMGIYLEDSSYFENNGTITMDSPGQGVYMSPDSAFVNNGHLVINGGGFMSDGDATVMGGSLTNVGTIVLDGAKVTISDVPVTNIGTITINGPLNIPAGANVILNTVDTDNGMGSWNILGGVIGQGNIVLSPGATQGNSNLVHNIQIMDFGTTAGDLALTSQSVTWLADKWYDDVNMHHVLRLTKIPYVELLSNTEAMEFGRGLDQIYERQVARELEMFDGIDAITNKDELAETFDMELRGNVYANIQQRMMDVDGALTTAYKQLKSEENPSKSATKISTIYSGGSITDKNPGVEEYDYQAIGVMFLREKETVKYGTNFNYSLGVLQSRFDFDQNSKEDVTSVKAGMGYEQYLKQGSRFKFSTRGEIGVNYHNMKREIVLSNGTYKNKGNFYSGIAQIDNRLNYELPIASKAFKADVYGSLNMGYGRYQGFKEKGDGVYLDVKTTDYFSLRPGVGIEGELSHVLSNGHKLSLTAGGSYEYETMNIYDDGNLIKIADTTAGYYNLEKPEKIDHILKASLGLGFETVGGFKIGAKVEREEGMKYQLNFSWKF